MTATGCSRFVLASIGPRCSQANERAHTFSRGMYSPVVAVARGTAFREGRLDFLVAFPPRETTAHQRNIDIVFSANSP